MGTPEGVGLVRDRFQVLPDDVVVRTSGESAWCDAALVFREGAPVALLYASASRSGEPVVFVKGPPTRTVSWLRPCDVGPFASEPPSAFEIAGVTYQRSRRVPVAVERLGDDALPCAEEGILAEYTAGDARRLVVFGARGRVALAFVGTELLAGTYDVLPAGDERR
ncbi:MAG: hypothetical protein U0169_16460 [Polyangiaceae bacterium]